MINLKYSKFTRSIAFILSIILTFSIFLSCPIINVNAATTTKYVYMSSSGALWGTNKNNGSRVYFSYYDFNGDGVKDTLHEGTNGTYVSISFFDISDNTNGKNKKLAYCIAPGLPIYTSDKIYKDTGNNINDHGNNNYFNNYIRKKQGLYESLGLAMYYGYGGSGSVVTNYGNTARVATQIIIWELVIGLRKRSGDFDYAHVDNPKRLYNNVYCYNIDKTNFDKATTKIIDAMKNHYKAPAFEDGSSKSDEDAAKDDPIILEYNQAKKVYTTTIKDGNKVLSKYGLYNYDSSKLKITKNTTNNTITISTKNNITSPLSIKLARNDIINNNTTSSNKLQNTGDGVWGNYNYIQDRDGTRLHSQCLSDGFRVDPVERYIAVKTAPTGSIEVTKNFSKNGTIVKISDDIRNKYKYFLKVVLKDDTEKLIRISKTSNGNYKFDDMNSTNNYYAVSDVVNNDNYYMNLPSSNNTNYKINITNVPQGKYRVIEYKDNNYYRSGYYVLNGNNKTVIVTGSNKAKTSFTNYSTEATITKEFDDPNMTNDDYKSVRLKLQVMYKDSTDNNKLKTGEVYFAQNKNNITDYTFDSFKSTASSGFDSNNYNRTKTIQFASKVKNTAYIHGLPIKNGNGDSLTYKVIETQTCGKNMNLSSNGKKSENTYFTFDNIEFTVSEDNVSKAKAKQIKTENHDNDIYQIDIKKKFTYIYNNNKKSLTKNEINALLQNTKFSIYKYNISIPLKLTVSGNNYNYDTSGNVTQFTLKYQSDGIDNLSITSIKNLPKGKYIIKEVSHPSGYIPETTSFVVEVNINNNTKTVSFENVKEESSDIKLHVEKDFVGSNGQQIDVPSTNVVANNKLFIGIVADVQVAGTTSKSTRLLRLGWSNKFKGYVYYDGLSTDDKIKYFGSNYLNTVSLSYLVQLKEIGSNKYGFDVYGLPKDTNFDVIEVMYGPYFYNAFAYKKSDQQWGFDKTSGELLSGYTKVDIPTSKANQTNISPIRKIFKNGNPGNYTYEYYSKNSDNIGTFRSTQWNRINAPTINSNNVVAKLQTKFENETITSSIVIKKTSEDEDVERQFEITGYYRNQVTDQVVYDNPIIIKTIKKSNGTYGEATVSGLPVYAFCEDGRYLKYYTIKEINCPNRYILPQSKTVPLINNGTGNIQTVEFNNTLRKASINVLKVGKKINRKTGEYETIEEPLKDVYFVLKDQDGNYYDKNGKQYLTQNDSTQNDPTILRTDSNGKININNLVIEKAVKNNNGKIKIVKMRYSLIEERSEHNYHNVNLKDSFGNKIGLSIPENESDRTYNIVFNLDDYTDNNGIISTSIVHKEKIYNEYIYGALTLTKYDADTNLPLMDDNIKFVVDRLNTNNEVIETIPLNRLVDEDNNNTNIYSVNYLPYGKYLLRESNMPTDVLKLNDPNAIFNINANGDFYKAYTDTNGNVSFTTDLYDTNKVYYNFPIKVNINLIKQDSKTNKPLNGAKFNLYLDSNDDSVYDEEDELIGKNIEIGDGETGEFVCLGDSDSNKTGEYMIYNVPVYYVHNSYYLKYFVVETEAPEGYEKSDDIYTVTVSNVDHNATYTPNNMPVQNTIINANTILNEKILGSASIVKYDDVTKELLSGAKFTLYVDNNGNGKIDRDDLPYTNTQRYVNSVIKTHLTDINQIPDILKKYYSNINEIPNRYFLITDGVIPEILDNSNNGTGRYVICGLPKGNYIIKETNPPLGYANNDNDYPFYIIHNNDLYEAADTYITSNTHGESEINLSGVTIDGVFVPGIPNNEIFKTVQIAKYTVKDFSNLANETFILSSTNSNNHTNDRYATANGTILTFNNVHKGGFWIQRCNPETHEIIDNTIYHIDVQQDSVGPNGEDVTIDLSQAHFPLKGAEFTLTNTNTNIKNIRTSTSKGFATFSNVGVGHYKVEETESPQGYTKSDVIEEFDITRDTVQKVFRFTFENKPANMNIRLYKVDRYNTTKYLSGAEYTIYKDVNKDEKYTSGTDLTLGTFDEITETLDDDTVIPVYEYKNLEYGTYFIQETKAPPGYTIDPTMHKIYINENTDYTDLGDGIRVAIMEVSEVKLARLPTAGGIGTAIFAIISIPMMTTPIILITTKKRKKD